MFIVRSAGKHYVTDLLTKRQITSSDAETAMLSAGVKVVVLPDADVAAMPAAK